MHFVIVKHSSLFIFSRVDKWKYSIKYLACLIIIAKSFGISGHELHITETQPLACLVTSGCSRQAFGQRSCLINDDPWMIPVGYLIMPLKIVKTLLMKMVNCWYFVIRMIFAIYQSMLSHSSKLNKLLHRRNCKCN